MTGTDKFLCISDGAQINKMFEEHTLFLLNEVELEGMIINLSNDDFRIFLLVLIEHHFEHAIIVEHLLGELEISHLIRLEVCDYDLTRFAVENVVLERAEKVIFLVSELDVYSFWN